MKRMSGKRNGIFCLSVLQWLFSPDSFGLDLSLTIEETHINIVVKNFKKKF